MALALWAIALTTASAQDLFLSPKDSVGACSNLEQDVNYAGGDLKAVSASSVDDCCSKCNSEPDCKYFTFHKGTRCYLKSSKVKSKALKGDVSGAASSTPSPPVPPTPSPPTPSPQPTPTPPGPP